MFHIVVESEEDLQHPRGQPLQGTPVRSSEPYYLDQYQFTPNPPMNKEEEKSKDTVPFYSGNPVVQSIKGLLHLCKPVVLPDSGASSDHHPTGTHSSDLWDQSIPEVRSNLLCILSVPPWMPPSEFCQWLRQYEGVQQLRFVRPPNPSHYMALLQFTSQHHADHFYMSSNAQPFNSMEPERCYAVFVREVTFIEPTDGVLFDNHNLKELPSCPVCLEKLDAEESGVVTSLCRHQYHISCLSQCERETSNCPVCRYSMQRDHDDNDERSVCTACDSAENLWICLLCGNIGCSRYKNEHAEMHYRATGHTYALEIDTQRVWDYTGDGYVHRLIQNHVDGKLVEIPDPSNPSMARAGKEKDHSKMDALAVEYNYLLTTQLESQRLYFEEREAEKESYIKSLEEKLQRLVDAPDPTPPPPDKKLNQLNARIVKLQNELATHKKEAKFLQEVNQQLVENQERWKAKVADLEQSTLEKLRVKEVQLTELEGQVRDLMLHLDSTQKCNDTSNELVDGSVIAIHSNSSGSADGAPAKKPKRRRRNK